MLVGDIPPPPIHPGAAPRTEQPLAVPGCCRMCAWVDSWGPRHRLGRSHAGSGAFSQKRSAPVAASALVSWS